ncbi:hypothetical protein AVEN_216283-1 [Araneus ventricosus]|uniref:Uncharacterized protein n=1 Tax=Araneus ventricosus TaxID=182803 RepID=A0A4Y2WH69_ARAVE|nr:hypothetical protein AVEN_216283-1 [Araneus ventricosus]
MSGVTSDLPKHVGLIEVRLPRQHSETEVGDIMAITGLSPTLPEGGTSRKRSGGNSTPRHYYTFKRSKNPLTYPRIRGANEGGE